MTHDTPDLAADPAPQGTAYRPPTVTVLGTLAELTKEKEVGAADGTMVLGVDVGS
jgi:hypothetical protein